MDWKIALLDSLASFFGDPDASHVTVLEMTETTPGHIKMRWTNDTLPRQACPKEDTISLYNKMTINERPSQLFKQNFRGQFRVQYISFEYRGLCSVRHSVPVTEPLENRHRQGQYGGGSAGFDNSMPQIRNPVDKLNVTAGELLQFQVPGTRRTAALTTSTCSC